MTIHDIRNQLKPHKRVTERQIRRYLRMFQIKHLGIRQRPQQYPANSAGVILHKLGLNGSNGKAAK